ncbi:MAG: MFS transporter [Promethearchaeota archaeon]
MSAEEDKPPEFIQKETSVLEEFEDIFFKNETMSLSIKEGLFGGLAQSLADQFITPYALSLQATDTQIGIMSSLLGILSPIGQIAGSNLMKKNTRRSLILRSVFLQLIVWPLIILLGIFALNNWFLSFLPIFLIIFYCLYSFFGSIGGPSWFSLMGDIVPESHRGRYFSKRNLFITAISISVSLLSSIALERFLDINKVFLGFSIIFFIAFISRVLSRYLLARHYYPSFKIEEKSYISLKKFIKLMRNNNFGFFTLFMTLIFFSVNIGAPFVGVYMWVILKFTPLEYVIVNLSTPLLGMLFYPLLGYLSDRFGNAFVLKICCLILPIVPILWIAMNTPLQLIFGPQLVSAFTWTGVNLTASNFIYDNVSSQERGFYVSYYSLFLGIGVLFGGIFGTILLSIVPVIFVSVYETLFLISCLFRLFFDFIFLYRIKEVRIKRRGYQKFSQ